MALVDTGCLEVAVSLRTLGLCLALRAAYLGCLSKSVSCVFHVVLIPCDNGLLEGPGRTCVSQMFYGLMLLTTKTTRDQSCDIKLQIFGQIFTLNAHSCLFVKYTPQTH